MIGLKAKAEHYLIEAKLRKLAYRVYGKNSRMHDKLAYFGNYQQDIEFGRLINITFDIHIAYIYDHKCTTSTYRNYNSLAVEIQKQINLKTLIQ